MFLFAKESREAKRYCRTPTNNMMRMLLLLGLASLASAATNEDSWSEGNDTINLTAPKLIELEIKHTSSPLFIQSAASNGVTKLGFDATKFFARG